VPEVGVTVGAVNVERIPSTRRAQLTQLTGPEATRLAYRGFLWQGIGLVVYVAGFLGYLSFEPKPVVVLSLVMAIPAAVLIVGLFRGLYFQRQAGRAASVFLSERAGSAISVKSGSMWLWVWRRELARSASRGPGR
jgi:hypothetical protein